MSINGTGTLTVASPSSPQKKWYEDEEVVIDKDEERQSQFSRAGVGFDAIQVKLQQLYEVGILKLFIETEILKSNTGVFEPGLKELYNPYSMTIPQRIGKDLLFTSDIEFDDSGFESGSLENDKKKIFLNRAEFTNYLLRLPKPISDAATPLDVKQDMNAYKYLQILGTELQDKILFLCDNFINGYNQQYKQNANDISRIQKEINDLKRLTGAAAAGSSIMADDIQNRIIEKENKLVQAKNIKIQLETKRKNYKNACTILSNSTRRSQYNASLLAAYPALKNDASSYSTVMLDWFKFKHNGSAFFNQVCRMFKPIIPKKMLTMKQKILIAIQDVATKLVNIFKPIFETYFFNELTTNAMRYTRMLQNNTYASYLFQLSNEVTRRSDPLKFSWININAMILKIIKETQFTNHYDKIELERLQSVSQLMANFNNELITLFSLFKFEKNLKIFNATPNDNKNVYERAEQDTEFFKHVESVNMLFQNVYYLNAILVIIVTQLNGLPGLTPLTPQQTQDKDNLVNKLNEVMQTTVNTLFPILNEYQVKVQRYDYNTQLGTASHSGFVENVFSGKIAFISHFHKNNKFLVSSEFIQNSPVIITIPDGNYTLEALSSMVEQTLCNNCKWIRKSNYDAEMLWRCKYDNNNVLQFRLYFPDNVFPPNTFPNINWGYRFTISSVSNIGLNAGTRITRLLYIPQGEYKNIRQVLDAMQKTINDVITKPSELLIRPFQSAFTITLELNTDPAVNAECIKFKLKKKSSNDPDEDLSIQLDTPNVSNLFCRNPAAAVMVHLNNNVDNPALLPQTNLLVNANSEKILMMPPNEIHLSKTISIDTATKIDGEEYDASDIFGISNNRAPVNDQNESLQLFPDIILNELYVSTNYDERSRLCYNRNNNFNFQSCIYMNAILDSQLELPPNTLDPFSEFGILDFTSKRINDELTFKPVNMKEIEKNANMTASITIANQNVFKNEILKKTGVYMNERLLHSKVPVISPVDILNSILYRYPCVPPVKRGLIEGSNEFDEFIQERVNVPNFNAIISLGKGEKDQTPSTTFKRVLEKTLMYDESDGRRNKLFCDLHYAVCGPVYTDENPSQEINQLTIMDQFILQNNRPDVVAARATAVPLSVNPPFKVKGITPFYDYEKEYYKYLIYGECQESTFTFGCIKYYDPGEKIGPGSNVNASELYDVIHVYSFQNDPSTGNPLPISSTIDNVLWRLHDQTHEYDKFIIVGNFQFIQFRNKYEKNNSTNPAIEYIPSLTTGYVIWTFPHEFPAPPVVTGTTSYFDFQISVCVQPIINLLTPGTRISNILQVVTLDYSQIRFVVFANNSQGETYIYLPFFAARTWDPRPIVIDSRGPTIIPYKVSCSAISVNKTLTITKNKVNLYDIMKKKYRGNPNPQNLALARYALTQQNKYGGQLRGLVGSNPSIENNLLWLGLKEKTQQRKILSCEIINVTSGVCNGLNLPFVFEDDDTIENIRVDINNPEIVTVFGRFKATVSDAPGPSQRPNKIIRNVMVIFTNLQNATQNDTTYGSMAGATTYSLTYDNFKEITVNGVPEFQSFYSCFDGLVAASIDKGTMQQNIGILTVKKTQTSGISVIGFHNAKMTAASEKSTVKDGSNPTPLLCYDYNMSADNLRIVYDDTVVPVVPPKTDTEQGVFNPLTFYAFYDEIENTGGAGAKTSTSLSKGVYALIHAKNPTQFFSAPSNFHVLNTWGIDLSSNQTLFYKRLYEPSATRTTLKFNLKGYEKYMNDIVDTILSSAKAYYEEKIKSTFYEYGTIEGNPSILFKRDGARNVIVGGGKEYDAKQMLLATEYALDNESIEAKKNRRRVTYKKKIEIRIPDIMMSDEYVSAITEADRKNVRMIFVNSIFKYSKQLSSITGKQNEDVQNTRSADNNIVVLDDYQIVLCSKNETIRSRFNELKALDSGISTDFLILSDDAFDFDLPSSSSYPHDKHIILVNEWNDKGFIGDYGAYAYSDVDADAPATVVESLTPNQMMISKSRQIVTEATTVKEAVTKMVPKYSNTAFLLNPVFSYHTLDPSKWTGVVSLFDKAGEVSRIQVGGARPLYPGSSYGLPLQDPYFSQRQALSPYGVPQLPYGYGYGYGYGDPSGISRLSQLQGYDGYRYGDNGDEVIRMKRKVLEPTDVPSKNLKKINLQTMQTDTRFKKIVLWLFDSRENKMLMTKTLIGNGKVVLSLPVQNQQTGGIRASGYSLLQQLCRRLFNQTDITIKWTLEVSYAYDDNANTGPIGVFIYSAKSYDLPKPTLELIYVNMQAVLNLTKGAIIIKRGEPDVEKENGSRLEINPRDIVLVGEVFRVVPLIQGGIISSTSKEFNEIVANLVSKTPHQHLRSSISEKKRRENVEKNIQYLINLFFPQNSLFFVRGQLKYYIYSSQRNCKIFTIVKQPNYDDDSYLTCLKLFLQSEYDYKQKLSTFRVGCSMKRKLIADNFSSVWDSFWNDLIESQQQAASTKQVESEIGITEAGEEQEEEEAGDREQAKEVSKDDNVTAPVCLNGALTTCKRMYDVQRDWNVSSYFPLEYDGIFYNLDPVEQYGFNNEYYYNLENLQTTADGDMFYGFKCMKYNGDSNHPILYLGGAIVNDGGKMSAVYELSLKTKKIKPILIANNEDSEILCIDMIGNKHLLIGGKGFHSVVKYIEGEIGDRYTTTVPLIIMNIETYDVTLLYDDDAAVNHASVDNENEYTNINRVCICKNRKIMNETQTTSYYEYVGLFGGNIQIETAGAGGNPNIINIGCVVVKIPIDDSNPNVQSFARMYCIDRYVETSHGIAPNVILGLMLRESPTANQYVNITSIVCDEGDEEEEKGGEEGKGAAAKNKTTFYVGGYFNAFSYMDYVGFEEAKAVAPTGTRVNETDFIKNGRCNSILKLSITSNYNSVDDKYRHRCTFEPVETNANMNNIIFNASLALNRVASKNYLLAFTAFFNKMTYPGAMNDAPVITTLNVFDLKTNVNTQLMIAVPKSRMVASLPHITKGQYRYQCLTIVQDVHSKKNIAAMNYTTDEYAYAFTSELNMEAPLRVLESKCNDEAITSRRNSITDMCGIENQNGNQADIYVVHENIGRENGRPIDQILYPLTVKSNYQQVGNWNMGAMEQSNDESNSIPFEVETFFRFVDSIIEMRKIFKEYPSMMLFLQNIDYRDKNQKITNNTLMEMYGDLVSKTSMDRANIKEPIYIHYPCNDVFLDLNFILHIWSIMTSATIQFDSSGNDDEINIRLFGIIKNFYDSFIFLLIYAGCNNLAQLLCNNYAASVLSGANIPPESARVMPVVLSVNNVKQQFMDAFEAFCFGDADTNNKFKTFFSEKAPFYDVTFPNIMICSNPETYTGVAYVARRLDKHLNAKIDEVKQKALQNKIYKSNETFFSANDDFFTTVLASDAVNTIDQINFCSFYKFQRFREDNRTPFGTNFGGMIDATIYACVNIDSNKKIESAQVLEFLKLIIHYFKRLPSGAPTVDIGISGPIKRIIFGGNFGCNLLHDAEVCTQFTKNGMKIYTMPNNTNAFTSNINDAGNQMFVVDANLMYSSSPPSSLSGGGGVRVEDNVVDKSTVKQQRRLTIGEPIQSNEHQNIKLIIVSQKKKTRRRYK